MLALFVTAGLWMFSGSAGAECGPGVDGAAADSLRPVAQFVEPPASAEPLNHVAVSYARDFSVSYTEALRRLGRVSALQKIMASIRDSESSRLAGWGIDHAGPFTAWVCLTGDNLPGQVASGLAERHSDVEIRTGATHTYLELRTVQAQIHLAQVDKDSDARTGSKVSVRVAYAGVDMSGNSVDVAIDPVIVPDRIPRGTGFGPRSVSDAVFEVEQARAQSVLANELGVAVKVSDGRGFSTKADFRGGEEMETCTSGFIAKRNMGGYGILTAGHCRSQEIHGVSLDIVGGEGARADAGFIEIPLTDPAHRLFDDYYCGPGAKQICDVTGTKDRDEMVGDYVCHTGKVSGVSCGTIEDNSTALNSWSQPDLESGRKPDDYTCWEAANYLCEQVFLRVWGPTFMLCNGDSGGPLYNAAGVAYGILRGGKGRCSYDGSTGIFSAIREAEAYVDVKVLTEDPVPPSSPVALTDTIDSNGIGLSWQAPPEGAHTYRVYRQRPGRDFEAMGSTRSRTYNDQTAVPGSRPGTEYRYRVTAINNLGQESDPGTAVAVSIPSPGQLSIALQSDSVSLSWPVPAGDVVSYEVYRRAAVDGQSYERIGTPSDNIYQDPLSGLTPGVEYYYRVKAVNGDGVVGSWGSGSNYARAVTPAVEGLRANLGSDSVLLSWSVPAGDVVSYEVYRRATATDPSYEKVSDTSDASFPDPLSGLTLGVEYYYRVKAVNGDGVVGSWGSGSNYARTVTPAVEGLRANLGSDSVLLSWSVPAGDVVSYEVYRRAAVDGQSYERIGTPSDNIYQDPLSGLTPGVEYYYRVKAVNGDGVVGSWGSGSNYARAVTPAVEGLRANLGSDSVLLSWSVPAGDVVSYEVYRRAAVSGQSYERISTPSNNSYQDPLSDLTPGMEYYYRIKAVNGDGVVGSWGSGSNYTRAVTPAVEGLKTTIYSNGVSLSWTMAGNAYYYEVYRRVAKPGESYQKIDNRIRSPFWDPLSGLTPGTEYWYRVKAVTGTGAVGNWGAGPNYASAVIPAVP